MTSKVPVMVVGWTSQRKSTPPAWTEVWMWIPFCAWPMPVRLIRKTTSPVSMSAAAMSLGSAPRRRGPSDAPLHTVCHHERRSSDTAGYVDGYAPATYSRRRHRRTDHLNLVRPTGRTLVGLTVQRLRSAGRECRSSRIYVSFALRNTYAYRCARTHMPRIMMAASRTVAGDAGEASDESCH